MEPSNYRYTPTLIQQTPWKKRKNTKALPPLQSTTDTGETACHNQPPEPPQICLPCCSVAPNIGRAARIVAHHTPVGKNLNIEHASADHKAHLEEDNQIRHRRPWGRRSDHRSDATGQADSPEPPTTTGGDFPPRIYEKEEKTHISNHGEEGEDTRADNEARAVPNPITFGEEMETTKETPGTPLPSEDAGSRLFTDAATPTPKT
jgi:hypothetical protein